MKFTFSLSRWYKVAERPHLAVKEREPEARTSLNSTVIPFWNRADAEEKAAAVGHRATEGLALVEAGSASIARIRAALAIRNVEIGESTRLCEVESAKCSAPAYASIVDGQTPDMVRAEAVRTLPNMVGDADPDGFARRATTTATLRVAGDAFVQAFCGKLVHGRLRATRSLDEIADLNREKRELELRNEVLELA